MYGANSVKYVISEKAISRALRARVVVSSAFTVKLKKYDHFRTTQRCTKETQRIKEEKNEALLHTEASQTMSANIHIK